MRFIIIYYSCNNIEKEVLYIMNGNVNHGFVEYNQRDCEFNSILHTSNNDKVIERNDCMNKKKNEDLEFLKEYLDVMNDGICKLIDSVNEATKNTGNVYNTTDTNNEQQHHSCNNHKPDPSENIIKDIEDHISKICGCKVKAYSMDDLFSNTPCDNCNKDDIEDDNDEEYKEIYVAVTSMIPNMLRRIEEKLDAVIQDRHCFETGVADLEPSIICQTIESADVEKTIRRYTKKIVKKELNKRFGMCRDIKDTLEDLRAFHIELEKRVNMK